MHCIYGMYLCQQNIASVYIVCMQKHRILSDSCGCKYNVYDKIDIKANLKGMQNWRKGIS